MEVNNLAECIECGAEIKLPGGTIKGEIFDCPECGVELEILNPTTGEFKIAETPGEDWGE